MSLLPTKCIVEINGNENISMVQRASTKKECVQSDTNDILSIDKSKESFKSKITNDEFNKLYSKLQLIIANRENRVYLVESRDNTNK